MSEMEFEGSEPELSGEPAAAEPTTTETPAAEPEGWAPSRDDWDQMNQTVSSIGQWFQEAAAYSAPEEVAAQEELDPWGDPEGFKNSIVEEIRKSIAPVMQPLAEKQSEELVTGWASEIEGTVGKYDRDLATEKAFALRAVNPHLDGRQALEMAAKQVKERDARIATEAVEAYKQSLANPGSPEPGVSGGAIQIEDRPSSYDQIIAKYAALNERS